MATAQSHLAIPKNQIIPAILATFLVPMIVLVIPTILMMKISLTPSKVPISPVVPFQKRRELATMKTIFIIDAVPQNI
jgi:hypothetical protein